MSSKWSYTDFLMYVIPGSYVLTVIYFSLLSLFSGASLSLSISPIVASVFLLFLVFILGNLVQALSHKGAETRLKKDFWKGYYPTQLLPLRSSGLVSEEGRASFLSSLEKLKLLTSDEVSSFNHELSSFAENSNELRALMRRSREIGDIARVLLQSKGHADRLKGTEAYYLMFRGLFFSNFWLGILFLVVLALNIARHYLAPHFSWLPKPGSELLGFAIPAALAVICLWLWRVFRDRCRGTAFGFSRELLRAVTAEAALMEGVPASTAAVAPVAPAEGAPASSGKDAL